MRAALQARDERLQMMLAGIAHEVRNPLGGARAVCGPAARRAGGQPERLQEVARIEREIGHLKAVVSEFLDYARRPRRSSWKTCRYGRCSTKFGSWPGIGRR